MESVVPSSNDAPTRGRAAGFAPRKSFYLRISPTLVLPLVLYLEPHHVEWMNVGVFERVLVALRERIPIKLEHEDVIKSSRGSGGGKQRDKVDVFRGTDYQMAFFFRTTNDKHVVLLKEKHLHYVTKSVASTRPSPPRPSSSRRRHDHARETPRPPPHMQHGEPGPSMSSSSASERSGQGEGRAFEEEDEDALGMMGPPPSKRFRRDPPLEETEQDYSAPTSSAARAINDNDNDDNDDDMTLREPPPGRGDVDRTEPAQDVAMSVKPEPVDDDDTLSSLLNQGRAHDGGGSSLFRREQEDSPGGAEDEAEEAQPIGSEQDEQEVIDQDIKPQLKVNYQKFEIFNRSLVVIVEPYPPLTSSAASSLLDATSQQNGSGSEVRQLSASVQPYAPSPSPASPATLSRRQDGLGGSGTSGRFARSESIYSRAGTLSVTPAPPPPTSSRRGGERGEALFRRTRSDTTPIPAGGGRPSEEQDGGGAVESAVDSDDDQMRGLRESSRALSTRGRFNDDEDEDEDEDEDDNLPSLEEILQSRTKARE